MSNSKKHRDPREGIENTGNDAAESVQEDGQGTETRPEQPNTAYGPTDDETSKRRRGRRTKAELESSGYYDDRPKTVRKNSQKGLAITVKDLAEKVQGGHAIAAIYFGQPIINLETREAEALASAILNLAQYYDIKLDGKWLAWGNLIAVLATVYGTRYMMYRTLRQQMDTSSQQDISEFWREKTPEEAEE